MVVAETQLSPRTTHTGRHFAAHLSLLNLQAVGHDGPRSGERNQITDSHVEGPTTHLPRLSVAGIHIDELDFVGCGMGPEIEHLCQYHPIDDVADESHLFDRQAERAQGVAELARITVDTRRELTKPRQCHLH